MLIFGRAVALITAVGTLGNIAAGAMTEPMFLVPDLLLGLALALAAVLPQRFGVRPALIAGFAFALGVFSAALSGQVLAGEPNWLLAALMAADLAALVVVALNLRTAPRI